MYIFIAKSAVELSDIALFEADQVKRSASLLKSPGFKFRLVLKDNTNPGVYFYISAWESLEAHRGFKADPDVKAWEGSLVDNQASFVELERSDCTIVVQDRVTG